MQTVAQKLRETLTSRKFWAAVASSVPFALAGDWQSFGMVWMTYAGIIGMGEAAHLLSLPSPKAAEVAQAYRESPSNAELVK